jgi:uncharacterized cupin superfamily protein
MAHPNLLSPDPGWDADLHAAPFRRKLARVGARAGAAELGASLYEVAPGGVVSPYHLHHGNEELLVVLAGRPELRTPAGCELLEPGAVVAFPRGAEGAHAVRNPGPETIRVLLVSTQRLPEVAEYPDTGATLTVTAGMQVHGFAADGARPSRDLVLAALAAES